VLRPTKSVSILYGLSLDPPKRGHDMTRLR
jgi:hypothetical protein